MTASNIVAAGFVVVALTFAVVVLRGQVRDARRHDAARERLLRAHLEPRPLNAHWDESAQEWLPGPEPGRPVLDTEPGTNLADRDACELMIADDPEFAAHCERLWAAIREQQKGEQA